jgi:hypothetical protein
MLSLAAYLLATPAWAAPPRHTVTVDPLTTALGFAHVQVERALGDRASIYVGPSLRLYDGILPDVNGPYVGLGAELGVRGFFTGSAPRGGWVMARGVLARVSTRDPYPAARLGGYTSALVGYTAVLGPGLVLSGGAGASWFDYGVLDYGPRGLAPALHTNVGVAF